MVNTKENIHNILLQKGRELVSRKGSEFLTARKLSEATGFSVGTIYNQFNNMDCYILEQNSQTLDELYQVWSKLLPDTNAYKNMNRYIDAFVTFVINHSNLWNLLFKFHLQHEKTAYPLTYLRKLNMVINLWHREFMSAFAELRPAERKVALQVLWISMFALSSFLTLDDLDKMKIVNKNTICKLLLNTYLAGLNVLKK